MLNPFPLSNHSENLHTCSISVIVFLRTFSMARFNLIKYFRFTMQQRRSVRVMQKFKDIAKDHVVCIAQSENIASSADEAIFEAPILLTREGFRIQRIRFCRQLFQNARKHVF